MVRGLELFRDHFKDYSDHYLIIGGTACDLAMEEIGESFRATKDLDIVLCLEVLNLEFVKIFWDFIRSGKYTNQQKSTGKKIFYRFTNPKDDSFPFMLELFSRLPDAMSYPPAGNLTPIPLEEDVSSLSAILLDDDYYRFILDGKRMNNGISVLSPQYIIPLKTKAWQDLSGRQEKGDPVSVSIIKKHQNDVFRLFRILTPDTRIVLPSGMRENMNHFLETMSVNKLDLKNLGYGNSALDSIIDEIRRFYSLDN